MSELLLIGCHITFAIPLSKEDSRWLLCTNKDCNATESLAVSISLGHILSAIYKLLKIHVWV